MTMLRGGAEIVGYELREDFANRAVANVRSFLGEDALSRYRVELRDCYEGIDETRPRPGGARPARAVAGGAARRPAPAPPAASSSPTPRASCRPRSCARRSAGGLDRCSARSRCCTGAGTSKARRCGPTTAWWRTPGFLTAARYIGTLTRDAIALARSGQPGQLTASMKMHSPGHSSADSMTASSWPSGMSAMPSAPWGLPLAVA